MTTWGDLRAGDVILDKTDVPWTVGTPTRAGFGEVRVTIRNEAGRSVPVVKPASEPVTLVEKPEPDLAVKAFTDRVKERAKLRAADDGDVAQVVVEDAFGEDKVSLIASETDDETRARTEATKDKPLELPQIEHPATLRSHLYLVHDFYVADVDSTLALKEHHRKQHADFPDQGTPHTHSNEGN